MATSLKARARSQSVDRDAKIMKIAEDILTVLKVGAPTPFAPSPILLIRIFFSS